MEPITMGFVAILALIVFAGLGVPIAFCITLVGGGTVVYARSHQVRGGAPKAGDRRCSVS